MNELNFKDFSDAVKARFDVMLQSNELYKATIHKDIMYDLYLNSFPDGTNLMFKERQEYDCNTCKNFIRDIGNVIIIKDGKLESVWDNLTVPGYYQIVADKMAAYVRTQTIKNLFKSLEKKAGCDITHQQLENNTIQEWHHFHCDIPKKYVNRTGDDLNYASTTVDVIKRGLDELKPEVIEIVLELIDQDSIYRGQEHKNKILNFKTLQTKYNNLETNQQKNIFLWENYKIDGARLRNEVIGTLLIDLSEGVELDKAVKSFETKVAPSNYKRPNSLITKGMIDKAMITINELGVEPALYRRPAVPEDISVNNVLFVDRSIKPKMKGGLSDLLMEEVLTSSQDFSKLEKVKIEDFIKNILPNTTSIEVLLENRHVGNLMTLIGPKNEDAPNIFKWDNKFTWSYNGNVTDSMKERVKNAGGNIVADLRFSIQWNDGDNNQNDFDAHCIEPSGNEIQYTNKGVLHHSSGMLDVDIVHPGKNVAVENITWTDINKMSDGDYKMIVHNYLHNGGETGFTAQIEFNNNIHEFSYERELRQGESVTIAIISKRGNTLEIKKSLPSKSASKNVWEMQTNNFQKVSLLTISPNFWNSQEIGNKHHFFILNNAKNPESPRGFYNEFLKGGFDKHRKVFEVLGNKTKCDLNDSQLSGLGFSSTKRDSVICKVHSSFTRMIEITF